MEKDFIDDIKQTIEQAKEGHGAPEHIIGDEDISKSDKQLATLDDMLLNTPTIALEQCKNVISSMADAIYENYRLSTGLIYNYDPEKFQALEENESFIDKCESALSSYIVKINSKRLSKDDRLVVSEILNSVSDFERMGDHCMNIYFVAQDKNEQNIHFSPAGHYEVDTIINAVDNIMKTTFDSFKTDDSSKAVRIEPMAETIDRLKEIIKIHHVERLQSGDCSIAGGISLVDLVTSFERIASHCANISLHIVKRVDNSKGFDEMHGHTSDSFSEEYKALYHYYESLYVTPVINEKQSLEAEMAYRRKETNDKPAATTDILYDKNGKPYKMNSDADNKSKDKSGIIEKGKEKIKSAKNKDSEKGKKIEKTKTEKTSDKSQIDKALDKTQTEKASDKTQTENLKTEKIQTDKQSLEKEPTNKASSDKPSSSKATSGKTASKKKKTGKNKKRK